jgi:hypothetical protein
MRRWTATNTAARTAPAPIAITHRSRIDITAVVCSRSDEPHHVDSGLIPPEVKGVPCMSVVVERGLARCPYCVAVTQYSFTELGPNSVCYEVDCKKCGECYRELHGPMAPTFGAVAVADWAPPAPAHAPAHRERMMAWLRAAKSRGRSAASGVTATLSALSHRRPADPAARVKDRAAEPRTRQ